MYKKLAVGLLATMLSSSSGLNGTDASLACMNQLMGTQLSEEVKYLRGLFSGEKELFSCQKDDLIKDRRMRGMITIFELYAMEERSFAHGYITGLAHFTPEERGALKVAINVAIELALQNAAPNYLIECARQFTQVVES